MTEELECITAELLIKGRNILCSSMYRPPNTNVKTFQSSMNKCMEQIKSETHCNSIIGMDHNLDVIKYNCHRDTENFINMMLENSSFPCITRPTRVTKSTATVIDNIFTSISMQKSLHSGIILHDISDHFPSIIVVEGILARKREQKVVYTRDITDCKISAIQSKLTSVNWSEFSKMHDVNESYDTFYTILSESLDKHMPTCEIKIPAKQYACEPWITKGLRKCGKKQLKLYKKCLISGNEDDVLRYRNYKKNLTKNKKKKQT